MMAMVPVMDCGPSGRGAFYEKSLQAAKLRQARDDLRAFVLKPKYGCPNGFAGAFQWNPQHIPANDALGHDVLGAMRRV